MEIIILALILVMIALQCVIVTYVRAYKYAKLTERYKVLFAEETLPHVVHGYLIVNSRNRNLSEARIPFSFEGVNTTPDLSLSLYKLIVESAEFKGYYVVKLVSYRGMLNDTKYIMTK